MTNHIVHSLLLNDHRDQSSQPNEKQDNAAIANIVNELFNRFGAIFPSMKNVFKSTEQLNQTKKQWVLGFIDSKINTIDQLEFGLKQCRLADKEFMPTI